MVSKPHKTNILYLSKNLHVYHLWPQVRDRVGLLINH